MSHARHVDKGKVACTVCHSTGKDAGVFQTKADCRACHHGPGQTACSACHQNALGGTLRRRGGTFSHKAHTGGRSKLACSECHKALGTGSFRTNADCAGCHHGSMARGNCAGCHAASLKKVMTVKNRSFSHDAHVNASGLACFECHSSAPGTRTGVKTAADCATCHHTQVKKPCSECHAGQWRQVEAGKMDYACSFCHRNASGGGFDKPQAMCGKCHALMKESEAKTHGAGACTTCHKPHAWAVNSFKLCLGCHNMEADDLHASVTGDPCTGCHTPHQWRQ